ncbi:S-adenosyl-L-methionine-dependent methyltransferase [Dichotomocladium elegans]|nr:S-adenosyl-L-methionine-dependent methyltransferase [Dichotomocladium elegans]
MGCFGVLRTFTRDLKKNRKEDNAKNNMSTTSDITSGPPATDTPSPVQISQSTQSNRYENGRRFNDDENVVYILPNDAQDDDRLHIQHWALKLGFGSNFDAPVEQTLKDGTNVLDSACGPGTWMLDMATMFPNSKFYGTDVSSRFPDQIKPKNSEFCVHNIMDDPPFEKDYFGYIHQRLVIAGIKKNDWPKVIENLKLTLKPGGWIELTEISFVQMNNLGPITESGNNITFKVLAAGGMDPDLGSNLMQMLSDAGFINIQKRTFDAPLNHGGKIGELFWNDFEELMKSTKSAYASVHPEFEEPGVHEKFIKDVGEECKLNKTTVQWTRAFAQKPAENSI